MARREPMTPRGGTRPIDKILMPFARFLKIEASGGILLLASTAIALAWANSPWGEGYDHFWHTYVTIGFGEAALSMSLAHFVNDGLMAIFFFVVGLEIKRELIGGELASVSKAMLPLVAAIGGMAVPALIYAILNWGDETLSGWAIPTATDIAFAVGIMAMLGRRVPLGLKVFLTALAIGDDLGAVMVIAIFYTSDIMVEPLIGANLALALSVLANRLGIRTPLVYALIGIFMWLMLLQSGVHATVGGVLLAVTIPARVRIEGATFTEFTRSAVNEYEAAQGEGVLTSSRRLRALLGIEQACEDATPPLIRLEHELHTWVAFLVMPIFALANAGVAFGTGFGDAAGSGVGLGVALGLLVGKPVGIMGATFLAVRLGLGKLPQNTSWLQILGASFLAGIGFTMSLFIANLAFREGTSLQLAKVGILLGSLIAGIAGYVILLAAGRREGT